MARGVRSFLARAASAAFFRTPAVLTSSWEEVGGADFLAFLLLGRPGVPVAPGLPEGFGLWGCGLFGAALFAFGLSERSGLPKMSGFSARRRASAFLAASIILAMLGRVFAFFVLFLRGSAYLPEGFVAPRLSGGWVRFVAGGFVF